MQAEARKRRPSVHSISQLFFEVAFEIMGRVAKVDGRVSEDEIRVARQIMQGMRLTPELTNAAIDCFTRGKSSSYPLTDRLDALAAQIGDRIELARAFVQLQLQAAVGAGAIDAGKRELLERVAKALRREPRGNGTDRSARARLRPPERRTHVGRGAGRGVSRARSRCFGRATTRSRPRIAGS